MSVLGFLNINKPRGQTSHDVVAKVRKLCGLKQVGHAGTLDPLAQGVLPVACGQACRLIRFLPTDKVYVAEILFGVSTNTDDQEGEVISKSTNIPSGEAVARCLLDFCGEIEQVPPLFSAVHVQGQRLYKLARRGSVPAALPVRQVKVFNIELLNYQAPLLRLRIHCSGGTYIRSIARDLGNKLGCGASLYLLVREEACGLPLSLAHSLEELEAGNRDSFLISPDKLLPLSSMDLSLGEAKKIRQGQRISVSGQSSYEEIQASSPYIMLYYQGLLTAIGMLLEEEIKPEVVLNYE